MHVSDVYFICSVNNSSVAAEVTSGEKRETKNGVIGFEVLAAITA